MAKKSKRIVASELQGFKYFNVLTDLLKGLEDVGTERDKAGNRELFCDQYLSLLLLECDHLATSVHEAAHVTTCS